MLKFRFEFRFALGQLARLAAGLGIAARPLMAAANVVERAIQRNFEEEGRPKRWESLTHPYATWKRWKFPGRKILELTGRLRDSITVKVETGPYPTSVAVVASSDVPYAAIHNFSGFAGEFHDIYIPPRPYLVLTREDEDEIGRAMLQALRDDG